MARHIREYPLKTSQEELFGKINQYLLSQGYEYKLYKGEYLFKKGNGIVAAPTFIKVTFTEDKVRLEAWLKFAILPGVYAGEMDLNGAMGFAIKAQLSQRVSMIEMIIATASSGSENSGTSA